MPMFPNRGDTERRSPKRLLRAGFAAAVVAACSIAGAVHAEVYRCIDASGAVTFTDDATACPKARHHEIQPRIQRMSNDSEAAPAPEAPPAAAVPSPPRSEGDDAGEKELWQQRKRQKEAELAALARRIQRLERAVTDCNRGLEPIARDDTGIKYRVSCDRIRREHAAALDQSREAREYLETGLANECRRAGCLPGWIR